MDYFFLGLGIFIAIAVVVGNYVIHRYYKKKYDQLLLEIGTKDFTLIKNIVADFSHKSFLSITWREVMADIILMDGNIIIAPSNAVFGGIIKQRQPIVQLVARSRVNNNQWITTQYVVKEKRIRDPYVKFILAPNYALELSGSVSLAFKYKSELLRQVYDYLKFG